MIKPTSIIINDLKNDIINSINESELPLCIIEPLMKDIYNEIYALSLQQLKKDQAAYKESLETKEEEE